MDVSEEEVMIASGHCGGNLKRPLPKVCLTASGHCGENWGVELPREDGMTASGHCGED